MMFTPAWFAAKADARKRLGAHRTALFRLAYMWCHDRALADDLTQEALAKALLNLHRLRDDDKLKPWLFGILINVWRDHLRSRRPAEDIDAVEELALAVDDNCEQAAVRTQLARRVRTAVAQLPLGQREVVSLVDLEDCSYAEAAQALAVPIGTVMSRLSRARAALREALADDVGTALAGQRPALRRLK